MTNDGLAALVSDVVWANPEEAAPVLVRMIGEASERQRSDATWLWGFGAKALTPEPLVALLSELVKCSAVSALGYYGDPRAIGPLRALLSDSTESIQRIVRYALRQLEKRG